MDYKALTIDDKDLFESYLGPHSGKGWEYNFFTLYAWDLSGERRIACDESMLIMYDIYENKCIFLPPYLKDPADFIKAVEFIEQSCPCPKRQIRIRGLNASQADLLTLRGYAVTSVRDDYDYLYASTDLKELKGKAFHAKRNFVNRFTAAYAHEFRRYEERDFDAVMALYDDWQERSPHDTSTAERTAIERSLKAASALNLDIGILLADGKLCGYSMSSTNPDGTVHTAFEKADTSYTGIYQALNQFAAQSFFADGVTVNRQEDLGIEGLRRAKLSYNPVELIEKYKAEKTL